MSDCGFVAIGFAHGYNPNKKELVVIPLTDDPERFKLLKEVYFQDRDGFSKHEIESCRLSPKGVHLGVKDVDAGYAYEKLVKNFVFVRAEDAVRPKKDVYFADDMLSSKVVDKNGDRIGLITGIYFTGANDVYVMKTYEGKEYLVPSLKSLIVSVDPDGKTITVPDIETIEKYNVED